MTVYSSANVPDLTIAMRNRTIIVITPCLCLAYIAVALRFIARWISRAGFWWDDWLALCGLGSVTVFVSLIFGDLPTYAIINGAPIDQAYIISNGKTVYAAEMFYYSTQCLLKFSILAFYWRIFSVSTGFFSIRYQIYCMIFVVGAWYVASTLVTAFQCVPVAAIFDASLRPDANCVELQAFFFGVSIPNILSDLFLIILPIPSIWRLKIPSNQRGYVAGFFLLGSFVLIASIIRLYYIVTLDLSNFSIRWAVNVSVIWSGVENSIGVVCVCLPSLRPILRRITGSLPSANTQNISSSFGIPSEARGTTKAKRTQGGDEFELLDDFETGRAISCNKTNVVHVELSRKTSGTTSLYEETENASTVSKQMHEGV